MCKNVDNVINDINKRTRCHNIISALISAGADVTAVDAFGNTPLHIFLDRNIIMAEALDLLIQEGADVNAQNDEGKTPAHLMVVSSRAIVSRLLEAGAGVNIPDHQGTTPFHLAIQRRSPESDAIILRIEWEVDVNAPDDQGVTPFHLAVLRRSPESDAIISKMLEVGADMNVQNSVGETPFYIAFENALFSIISLLLDTGDGDMTIVPEDGVTVLHHAVRRGGFQIVYKLVQQGASVDVVDDRERTPSSFCY